MEEYTTDPDIYESSRAGLGLAISRQVIDTHHGAIFAESKGPGVTFVFVLPYGKRIGLPDINRRGAGFQTAAFVD